jgi:cytochrome o ubiquinol oxidase subunit 1
MIWYIWWLAAIAFVGVVGYAIWHTCNYNRDYNIPATDVMAVEDARGQILAGGA